MGPHHYMDYLRKEQEELLNLAGKIEDLLANASKNNFSEHPKILNELRSMEHGFTGIVEHCHAADRLVEAALYRDLPPAQLMRIGHDHRQIGEAVTGFREELKCATPDRTMAMIIPGMDLAKLLRDHIAFESELFDRLAQHSELHGRSSGTRKTAKGNQEKKRTRLAKHQAQGPPENTVPYTLEPHLEL